jgi:hypothetical protein
VRGATPARAAGSAKNARTVLRDPLRGLRTPRRHAMLPVMDSAERVFAAARPRVVPIPSRASAETVCAVFGLAATGLAPAVGFGVARADPTAGLSATLPTKRRALPQSILALMPGRGQRVSGGRDKGEKPRVGVSLDRLVSPNAVWTPHKR